MNINNRHNGIKITILYFLVSATFFNIGCFSIKPIYNKEEKQIAENATKKFHQLYNENKFAELYELTDERARVTKKKEDFLNLVNYTFTSHGRNKESTIVDSKVIHHALFSEVQLLYKTNFEKSEQFEEFIWYVADGKAGLFSYGITNMEQLKSNK